MSDLQITFYFIIIANSLSFLDPSGATVITMTRIVAPTQSLSGIWTSLTAIGAQITTNLYINGS